MQPHTHAVMSVLLPCSESIVRLQVYTATHVQGADRGCCTGPARSFKLSQDGGAVLMQNPDGTEALMLLVSDLKRAKEDLERKEKAAQAERDRAPLGSYEVHAQSCPHDHAQAALLLLQAACHLR